MFSRTIWECLDFSTTTLLSLTAVCILRTFDWLLGFRNHDNRLLGTHTHTGAHTHTERLTDSPTPWKAEERWSQSQTAGLNDDRCATGQLLG